MIKFLLLNILFISGVSAYVPTVESLLRHGANPDVTQNGVSLTLVVKRLQLGARPSAVLHDVSLLKEPKQEEFFKIFFNKSTVDSVKLSQARFSNGSFSESALEHKIHYSAFNGFSIKPGVETMEKGIFMGLLASMALNNGTLLVNYLKSLGAPVKLNTEILNRQKVELLASYKQYLTKISRDRSARNTEVNPLRPDDRESRERAEQIMNESMYADLNQVKLSREDGQIAWLLSVGAFEAVVSYQDRAVQRETYKSPAGEFEILARDYWLANGTHAMPRFLQVRSINGETFQVEIKNLRHYSERDDDVAKRVNKWDQQLKGKASADLRPDFLL